VWRTRAKFAAVLVHAGWGGKAVSFLALLVPSRGGSRFQQAVIWPKNLQLDMRCQAVTMTSMHAVDAPQCPPSRGYRRLGYSVTDPIEDAGQPEAMP